MHSGAPNAFGTAPNAFGAGPNAFGFRPKPECIWVRPNAFGFEMHLEGNIYIVYMHETTTSAISCWDSFKRAGAGIPSILGWC